MHLFCRLAGSLSADTRFREQVQFGAGYIPNLAEIRAQRYVQNRHPDRSGDFRGLRTITGAGSRTGAYPRLPGHAHGVLRLRAWPTASGSSRLHLREEQRSEPDVSTILSLNAAEWQCRSGSILRPVSVRQPENESSSRNLK